MYYISDELKNKLVTAGTMFDWIKMFGSIKQFVNIKQTYVSGSDIEPNTLYLLQGITELKIGGLSSDFKMTSTSRICVISQSPVKVSVAPSATGAFINDGVSLADPIEHPFIIDINNYGSRVLTLTKYTFG